MAGFDISSIEPSDSLIREADLFYAPLKGIQTEVWIKGTWLGPPEM
jgi:hypothetical protein